MTEETKTANIADQSLHQHDADQDHQRRNEWIATYAYFLASVLVRTPIIETRQSRPQFRQQNIPYTSFIFRAVLNTVIHRIWGQSYYLFNIRLHAASQ